GEPRRPHSAMRARQASAADSSASAAHEIQYEPTIAPSPSQAPADHAMASKTGRADGAVSSLQGPSRVVGPAATLPELPGAAAECASVHRGVCDGSVGLAVAHDGPHAQQQLTGDRDAGLGLAHASAELPEAFAEDRVVAPGAPGGLLEHPAELARAGLG